MKADITLYCSFCGKSQYEIHSLVAGPTVFICDECVDLCAGIVAERKGVTPPEVKITEQSVDHAIDSVLGPPVAKAMRDGLTGRTTLLRDAIMKAFVHGAAAFDELLLREAQRRLDKFGEFRFDAR